MTTKIGTMVVAVLLGFTHVASAETVRTVASGLDNPRGLAFAPDGSLYVAEAGRGGLSPCGLGPEGPRCYGATGAVTRINLKKQQQERVAFGLPSLATDGAFAAGPLDIGFVGRGDVSITVGFAGDPRDREVHFGPFGGSFARLARMTANGDWRFDTNLGSFELANNPAGDEVDSNPYGLLKLPGKTIVADAGANDLLQVKANGSVTALAVFPNRLEDAPAFLQLPAGAKIPMDAVPTCVAVGPDGHYYVGQLTGFPFPVDGANVYRVAQNGGIPELYAGGFTAIIDIAFGPDGSMYVLELARNGLLAAFEENDWVGALIRVMPDGSRHELAPGKLVAPGGVTVGSDGSVFVTVNSISPSIGSVLLIQP